MATHGIFCKSATAPTAGETIELKLGLAELVPFSVKIVNRDATNPLNVAFSAGGTDFSAAFTIPKGTSEEFVKVNASKITLSGSGGTADYSLAAWLAGPWS